MKSGISAIILALIMILPFESEGQIMEYITAYKQEQIQTMFKPIRKRVIPFLKAIEKGFDSEYWESFHYDTLFSYMNYDVDVYYLENPFEFDVLDSTIHTSGVVLIPTAQKARGEVVYCHGTISPTRKNSEPSYIKNYHSDTAKIYSNLNYPFLMASMGYVVYVPDYIGYGKSEQISHPYAQFKPNAEDFYQHYQAFHPKVKNKIEVEDSIFITGISEGGAIAMGIHRVFEEHANKTIAWSSLCSGPYDLNESIHWFSSKEKANPFSCAAYKWSAYELCNAERIPLDSILRKPPKKAEKIYKSSSLLFTTKKPKKIFTENALNSILSRESKLNQMLKDHSPVYFKPKSPIYLYHGEVDDLVPFENTLKAKEVFEQKKVSFEVISFPKLGHISIVQPYIFQTMKRLNDR